jgi:RNA polymerase sigma-70 factor (ECF subfamily)
VQPSQKPPVFTIKSFQTKHTTSVVETHKDIVEACKQGSAQAQFELYRLYSKAMYNVCLRMVRHTADAEDVLQQTFLDVFTKLESFAYQSAVGAWIRRITINNCINFLQRRRLVFDELDTNTKHIIEEEHTDDTQISLSVAAVQRAMTLLPDGYRVVLSLYLFEGYDHEEISQILSISESTSKSQFSRAKQKIREIVKTQM